MQVSSANLLARILYSEMKAAHKEGDIIKMDIEKVFSLMDKAEKSSFNKIEIEIDDIKLRLDRSAPAVQAPVIMAELDKKQSAATEENQTPSIDDYILAPISGVFYVAKAPGEPPLCQGRR